MATSTICAGAKISFQQIAGGRVALQLTVELPATELQDLLRSVGTSEGKSTKREECDTDLLSPKSDRFPSFDPFEQILEIAEDEAPNGCPGSGGEAALQEVVPVDEEEPAAEEGPCEVLRSSLSLKVLRRHSSWVNGVAWAADQDKDEKIVTGSSNHTACIWKPSGLTQWKAVKTLRAGSSEGFRALAWSPDCSRLVAAGMENQALVYVVSGGEHRQWEANGILRGHTDMLRAVAWSPCGRKVLTGGDDKTARIWKASRTDPLSWEQVAVLHGHCDSVRAVAWRPDEKARSSRVVIAAGLADSTIVLWHSHMAPHDRRVFEVFATLSGHSGAVRSLDWTWDGAFLASGSTDATARIWNSEGWHEVAKLDSGNCAGLKAVAWSPDGKHLAAGGADAILRVWTRRRNDWNLAAELTGHQSAIRALCWSPDGQKVLTGSADRTARIWRVHGT